VKTEPLRHALLEELGVEHGFGVRGFVEPPGLRRPKQVHGRDVVDAVRLANQPEAPPGSELKPFEADAIVSGQVGVGVAIVTADCVPILLADRHAGVVAAVHAGWRGLASGVIRTSVAALSRLGADPSRLAAVVGPYIGACCYEVDEPVLAAFTARFETLMRQVTRPTRAGHARLDLGAFATAELVSVGLARANIGSFAGMCTSCDRDRFHSYRRDGGQAGRMLHFVRTPGADPVPRDGRPRVDTAKPPS
jgi:YfiH family protein